MRFTIDFVSDWSDKKKEERELNTLEELLALTEEFGLAIIVRPPEDEKLRRITVYDDYIE